MSATFSRGEYYARMVHRAFEVVRKKHAHGEEWPRPGGLGWAEAHEPALYAKVEAMDKAISDNWDNLSEDDFKAQALAIGKLVMEILEKQHAWELAQPKATEPSVPPPEPTPAPYSFRPPPVPVQGRLI